MSNYVINIKNVSKKYNLYKKPRDRIKEALNPLKKKYHEDFFALKDINIQVKKGEMVGFIGENGSGKSTLLKIITGVLTPSTGEVGIIGNISALLELGSGFNPEYTGMENIYLNGMILGYTREEIDAKIADIIGFADIGEHINQPVKTYSSGMFVRLAFAVAINVDPEILIIDEALAVGDLEFQLKCMEKFSEFMNSDKTILFVSHDVNAVRRFCDKVYWLKDGVIEDYGDTMEVTERYDNYLKKKSIGTIKRNQIEEEKSVYDIVDVVSCEILDSNNAAIDMVPQNSELFVKITYHVNESKIASPVLGIAIRTMDHRYVCGLNTLLDEVAIPWEIGLNTLYLKYERMGLLNGEYYFDVGIFEENATVPLVYLTKFKNFFVTGKYIGEGIVVLEHQWNTEFSCWD